MESIMSSLQAFSGVSQHLMLFLNTKNYIDRLQAKMRSDALLRLAERYPKKSNKFASNATL